MNIYQRRAAAEPAALANRRAWWMRQLRQWHWISAAVSLVSTLLFALTGFTLNHSAQIEAKHTIVKREAVVPADLHGVLKAKYAKKAPVPAALSDWAAQTLSIDIAGRSAEWSDEEVYVALPRAGGDAWLNIDRETGDARYERTDRGWIAYLNDLHKGRNAGPAWSIFIDVFAAACVVFSVTGLLLLQMYASGRTSTWPLVGFGVAAPLAIAIFFIH